MRAYKVKLFSYKPFLLSIFLSAVLSCSVITNSPAQVKDSATTCFILKDIVILGNKVTKDKIILRELNVHPGDTICSFETEKIITESKNRIFNTSLFISVDVHFTGTEDEKTFLIVVKERWYTYPIPVLGVADRNFNEWWQTRNHDLRRLEFGINFIRNNFRGRNEILNINLIAGFTKKAEITYSIPYISKTQKTGISMMASYISNKQIPIKTSEHELIYFEGDKYIRKRFRSNISISRRSKFYLTHLAGLTYYNNSIADTVAKINPSYFLNGNTRQRYFALKYTLVNNRTDVNYYPLKGRYGMLEIEKAGLTPAEDLDLLTIRTKISGFVPLSRRWFIASGVSAKISFPQEQPYFNIKNLGYERELVSGYELYVIDGQNYYLGKLNLKYQLFSSFKEINSVPVTQFSSIPLAIYLKGYIDGGYATDQSSYREKAFLSNRFLLGGGLGLDFVTYYDLVFRMEYSINKEGLHGFYLNMKAGI